jgi:hypothetical protein
MKRTIIITFLFLIFNQVNAQHCGFDFSSIIVLNIHTKEKPDVIPNLKIELIGEVPNNFGLKTLKFEQGLEFAFIKDSYGLVIPSAMSLENFKIKITDIDGFKNEGFFKEIIISTFNLDKYPLCGNYNRKEFVSIYGCRLYKPIEVIHYPITSKSGYKNAGKINNHEIIYDIKYTNFNNNLPEYLTFYIKENEEKHEMFKLETSGAYIGEIECFKVNNDDFIYVRLDETSGIQYGAFYSIDIINKKAKKVIQDFGNYKIPSKLENYSGFGILKDKENNFHSGLLLRTKENNERYVLTRTHKLVLNENKEFVLKVVDNKLTGGQY